MESASERLAERLAELPEDERETLASDILDQIQSRERVRRKVQVAIEQIERGEAGPLESHEAFMSRMRAKHNLG